MRKLIFLLLLLFALALLAVFVSAQEPKSTKSTRPPGAKACADMKTLTDAFVADTARAAKMTPEDRQKDEERFNAAFEAAAKACRAEMQKLKGTKR